MLFTSYKIYIKILKLTLVCWLLEFCRASKGEAKVTFYLFIFDISSHKYTIYAAILERSRLRIFLMQETTNGKELAKPWNNTHKLFLPTHRTSHDGEEGMNARYMNTKFRLALTQSPDIIRLSGQQTIWLTCSHSGRDFLIQTKATNSNTEILHFTTGHARLLWTLNERNVSECIQEKQEMIINTTSASYKTQGGQLILSIYSGKLAVLFVFIATSVNV